MRIAILRCEYTKRFSDEAYIARQRDGVAWAAEKVERALRDLHQDVTVRGWVMPIDEGEEPYSGNYPHAAVRRLKESEPTLADFDPEIRHYWGGATFQYCGHGGINQRESVTYWPCGHRTMVHEILHNLGLNHSNGYNRDGNLQEYADATCFMGKGSDGLNAWQRQRLGLPVKEVSPQTTAVIVPCEYDPECVRFDECQQARIGKYALSARRRYPGKVFVYDVSDRDEPALVETLSYGDEFEGVILAEPGPWPGRVGAPPEPGLYYDPRFDGQGLEVFEKDGMTGFVWYTFEDGISTGQKVPSRRFYSGKINPDGYVKIFSTFGGSFENPAQRQEYQVGEGQFRDGLFLFDVGEYGRGCMRLTRLMTGGVLYQSPGRDGEGFSFYEYEGDLVGFWYTYGPPERDPMGRVIENTGQRWYMLRQGGIYEVTGPQFMTGWDYTENKVGTFEFDGSRFSYSFEGDTQTLPLGRFM